jgi:hypothetical protein
MHRPHSVVERVLRLALGLALLATACTGSQRTHPNVDSVAIGSTPPAEPFRTTGQPAPLLPRVPSRGDCAPRYSNGTQGTCVNDKPCRGFGVRDGKQVICACFVRRGGCDEDERCEPRQSRCVKESKPEFDLHL